MIGHLNFIQVILKTNVFTVSCIMVSDNLAVSLYLLDMFNVADVPCPKIKPTVKLQVIPPHDEITKDALLLTINTHHIPPHHKTLYVKPSNVIPLHTFGKLLKCLLLLARPVPSVQCISHDTPLPLVSVMR